MQMFLPICGIVSAGQMEWRKVLYTQKNTAGTTHKLCASFSALCRAPAPSPPCSTLLRKVVLSPRTEVHSERWSLRSHFCVVPFACSCLGTSSWCETSAFVSVGGQPAIWNAKRQHYGRQSSGQMHWPKRCQPESKRFSATISLIAGPLDMRSVFGRNGPPLPSKSHTPWLTPGSQLRFFYWMEASAVVTFAPGGRDN